MIEHVKLTNKSTSAVLELDSVSTPVYILDSVDWGSAGSTHHSSKYVDQIGEYATSTSIDTRSVEITGWIVAEDESRMIQYRRFLNSLINPKQALSMEYKEYVLTVLPNSSVRYSVSTSENNEVMCKFKLDGFCPDPAFYSVEEDKVSAASTTGKFRFPLVISAAPSPPGGVVFGERKPSLIASIFNNGTMAAGMRIVLKANGSVVEPTVTNVITNEFIKIRKTMVAGETIEISTVPGDKYIMGGTTSALENYFRYRDYRSSWLQLEVGETIIAYSAASNVENLDVFIYHYDKFLEVQ